MMSSLVSRSASLRAFASAAIAASVIAVAPTAPVRAQDGPPRPLDVPYVPTPQNVVDTMLKVAGVSRRDFLIDLGCGDGRIPVTAAGRFGTKGFGVDLNPVRVKEAKEKTKLASLLQTANAKLIDMKLLNHPIQELPAKI